jgi:vacuolar-type H+-ATPase subunit H
MGRVLSSREPRPQRHRLTTAPDSPVADYVHRLDRELRVRRAPRRRLLAEAEDHLRSSADELVSAGRSAADAEREAVARFGAAADVARGFAHAAASSTARAAVAWAAAVFLAYGATATLFLVTAPSWLRDFPHGAPSTLALQVAGVALAVTAIRAARWRGTLMLDEERLRLVANGALIAALAVGAGASAELLVALTRPAAAPWSDAAALIAAFALAVVLGVPAALVAAAAHARANGLGALPGASAGTDRRDELTLADDVAALVPVLGGVARAALRRPGRTCAAAAGAAFVAVAAAQLAETDARDASIVLGALAVGLLEAVAIVIGFLTLGGPLGLRTPRRTSRAA